MPDTRAIRFEVGDSEVMLRAAYLIREGGIVRPYLVDRLALWLEAAAHDAREIGADPCAVHFARAVLGI